MQCFLSDVLRILTCQTFWTAIGAIAAIFAAVYVCKAAKQIQFSGWIRAQEIFTEQRFLAARQTILHYFSKKRFDIKNEDEEVAKFVCRKMDELARLKPYISKRKILKIWGHPLAKCWMVLERTVEKERYHDQHPNKWEAFEKLGRAAVKKFHLEEP